MHLLNLNSVKKLKIAAFVVLVIITVSVVVYLALTFFKPKTAGIRIESNPISAVYIDGNFVGRTPFRQVYKAGEITIRLIPEAGEVPLAPYETKLNLVNGVETAIRRDFAEDLENSSGEVISFEKNNSKEVGLAIISLPDQSQVFVDKQFMALTPYQTLSLAEGEHEVRVTTEGYHDRSVNLNAQQGYKLTVEVHLAKDDNWSSVNNVSELTDESRTERDSTSMVEILSTPVGYLRVRKEPSTAAEEIGRVSPAKQYKLVDQDPTSSWYKIRFDEDEEGWISNQYSKIVGSASVTPVPSITNKLSPTAKAKISPIPDN